MAVSTQREEDPIRLAMFAGVFLLLACAAVLYLMLVRPRAGANAPPPHTSPRGHEITDDDDLPIGMQVEVLSGNGWRDAEVISATDDGYVRVHYHGWSARYDDDVPRDRVRAEDPLEDDEGP